MNYESVVSVQALFKEVGALAGTLSVVIFAVVQLIKKSNVISNVWLPWVSMGLGGVASMIVGGYLGGNLFVFCMAGIVSGLVSSGAYDATKILKGVSDK